MLSIIRRELITQISRKPFMRIAVRSQSHVSKVNEQISAGFGFELSEEQRGMLEMVQKFTREEIIPVAAHHDKTGEFPWDVIKKAHALGLMSTSIPTAYGGQGLPLFDHCLIDEATAYGCTGIGTALTANSLGQAPVMLFGNEEQKKEYLGRCTAEPVIMFNV